MLDSWLRSPIWREPGSLLGATSETPQSELQRSTPPFISHDQSEVNIEHRVPVSRFFSLIPRESQGFTSQVDTETKRAVLSDTEDPLSEGHFFVGRSM